MNIHSRTPYLATIIGTPDEFQPKLPEKIDYQLLSLTAAAVEPGGTVVLRDGVVIVRGAECNRLTEGMKNNSEAARSIRGTRCLIAE